VPVQDFTGESIALIRGGHGIGDMLQCTPVVRRLKEAGCRHITVVCYPSTEPVMRHNPYVDLIEYFDPAIDNKALPIAERLAAARRQEEHLARDFDLVINLAQTVEGDFVYKTAVYPNADGSPVAVPALAARREKAKDVNLFEQMIIKAGLPLAPGDRCLPELYFSTGEDEDFAAFIAQKKKATRWVLWNPTGSSAQKTLHGCVGLIRAALEKYPDSHHFMVGSLQSNVRDPRVSVVGMGWDMRTLFSRLRAMDLVVAPDSALLNAAGAFQQVAKLGYFTHSYPGHILKHFDRADSVQATCSCSPCLLLPVDYSQQWDHPAFRQNARLFYKHCMAYSQHDMYQPVGYTCTLSFNEEEFTKKVLRGMR